MSTQAAANGSHSVTPARRIAILLALCAVLRGEDPATRRRRGLPYPTWEEIADLADSQLVLPWLWPVVKPRAHELPPGIAERLHDGHAGYTVRNLRMREELHHLLVGLGDAGVFPLVFKGALTLLDGAPGGLGARWLSDLDLAVPPGQREAALAALDRLGYSQSAAPTFHNPYSYTLTRPEAPAPLDLHFELGASPLPSVLPIEDAYRESAELTLRGARVRGLSPTHQVIHNVIHTGLQDMNHAVGGLSLRQLLALRGILQAHGASIDWSEVRRRMSSGGVITPLDDYVWVAHRLLGMPLPDPALGSDRRLRHRLFLIGALASFGLEWPADLHRNLRYAFGRDYLDSVYGHGGVSWKVLRARARHAVKLARRDRKGAMRQATQRRV